MQIKSCSSTIKSLAGFKEVQINFYSSTFWGYANVIAT